tara:strand:- start:21837 stop:22571 length:735 start_codon:yes stop_codon:yes gene_type:complete
MHNTSFEAIELFNEINIKVGQFSEVSIAVCPPFTAIESLSRLVKNSNIRLGAQNMHQVVSGAYTGEISAGMLRSLFCSFVIIGHSERRNQFAESDSVINEKVKTALGNNLKPILCVGESFKEREEGKTEELIEHQVKSGLASIHPRSAEKIIIAYEPIWAIGTGKNATPKVAQQIHKRIRNILSRMFSDCIANRIRIIYGGSMKSQNASCLLSQPDIDGGLIGGASLDSREFIRIVEIAVEKTP